MIASIDLTNFKCFKSLSVNLGSINILAGTNGAGKSTVVQALLAMRQSWTSGSLSAGRLDLNGAFTQLGTAGEVYCAEPSSDVVEITLTSTDRTEIKITSAQDEPLTRDYFLRLRPPFVSDHRAVSAFGLFSEPFNYLHAERFGPRKVAEIDTGSEHPLYVGMHGEFAPFIATAAHRERPVINDFLVLQSSDGNEYPTLHYQWPLWMEKVFPGFDVESAIDPKADLVRLGFALQRSQAGQSLFVRPQNTGFGLSFVLGIVVASLIAEPNTLLIVENPEAHLHPRAQSAIGELLARVAAGGTQLVIETHSEHVVNGIRRMVKQEILKGSDARVYFFDRSEGAFEPRVVSIPVGQDGGLSAWPEGFFDQLDADLSVILD